MDKPELRLVTARPAAKRTPAALILGAVILAAAALATLGGADAARRPLEAGPLAESALAATLAANDPAPARRALDRLRGHLRETPLDAAARTIAASLMAETAGTDAARAAAAAQALAATRLVASDEWIAHGAARVLARCGRHELALHEVARMFGYAPDDAAAALGDIEPFIPADRLEDGLPPTPAAWLAWSQRLRVAGREAEGDARLAALLSRWPGNLTALGVAASIAMSRDLIDELTRLVPPTLVLPDTQETASLHACRARSKAASGDPAGARADALHAIELSRGDPWILTLAGEALAGSDPALTRDLWSRALYRLSAAEAAGNGGLWLRARLARLDEREGRAGDALREWREILASHPDDGEAKRRVEELTGAPPR